MKTCSMCGIEKTLNQFAVRSDRSSGHVSACKDCLNAYYRDRRKPEKDSIRYKEWVASNRDKRKQSNLRYIRSLPVEVKQKRQKTVNLKRKYGLTLEQYQTMLSAQDSKCAICYETLVDKKICVDHDHDTNAVRQLLCQFCNSGLGMFFENIETMTRAIEYLTVHKARSEAA